MSKINQKERAAHAWPLLCQLATNRGVTSYGELGQQLGVHHRAIRYVLSEIQDYCLAEKLPPITILIVGAGGIPGAGFVAWDVDDLESGFDKVYKHPWGDMKNPFGFAVDGSSIKSVADGVFRHTLTPNDAYSRVKVRGMAQAVFRAALLQTYGGRCALSDVYSSQLLEAAHIIPWSTAKADQRINPRNGVLLSTINHRFLDLGWLTINDDYTITTDFSRTRIKSLERELLIELNGARLRLPSDQRHWPDPAFIRQRNAMG